MRHFLVFGSVTALAFGVLQTAPAGSLIALSGRSQRQVPSSLGAATSAIDVSAITIAADHHLAVAAGTVVQTRRRLHRRQGPMRAGLKGKMDKYLCGSCNARPWGAVSGDWSGRDPVSHLSQRPSLFTRFLSWCHFLWLSYCSTAAILNHFARS